MKKYCIDTRKRRYVDTQIKHTKSIIQTLKKKYEETLYRHSN